MKFSRRDATKLLAAPVFFGATAASMPMKVAATTESPEFREAVQAAMLEFIDATKIDGQHLIFDPVKGDYVSATFKKLHSNLMQVENTFYVSCADFETRDGELLDVDYMVAEADGYWTVFQTAIHVRGDELRETHMETARVIFEREGGCGGKCCAATCCTKKCCAATTCNAKP